MSGSGDRFRGLTTNGELPGGKEGWEMRRLLRTWGVIPIIGNQERGRGKRKPGKKGNDKEHGIKVWRNGIREVY